MSRKTIVVGISVFGYSVLTELLCIRILRGSLFAWLYHPNRRLLLLSMVAINLLNALTAVYFSSRANRAEVNLKRTETRRRDAGMYLNHHLRNVVTVLQNAAFLTNDAPAIKLCNDAVAKIVNVLASTDADLRDPSERLFSRGWTGIRPF